MPDSTNSESSPSKPSNSLLVELENLQQVTGRFNLEDLEFLKAVLRQEQMAHYRRAVYSTEDWKRHESNGIVKWIDEWLLGMTEARYSPDLEDEDLGIDVDYMEPDGLPEE